MTELELAVKGASNPTSECYVGKKKDHGGLYHGPVLVLDVKLRHYRAKLMALVSRITVTLIWPG